MSLAGTLSGITTPTLRNFKLIPYVLGNATKSGVKPVDTEDDYDAGGDIKYNVTPSLTLDGTINTDFAQVEVDDQQVNLDRFNLFFPEKRPFFLENAGFFSVGNPGEVDLFFSRRIGLDAAGEAVPIIGGGRLSGKAGRYNVGLLNMQTNRRGRHRAGRQLHRGPRRPRPAQSLVDRRPLRQPRRHRRSRRRRATTTRPMRSTAGSA